MFRAFSTVTDSNMTATYNDLRC